MSRKRFHASPRRNKVTESGASRLGLPVFLLIASLVLAGAGFLLVKAFKPTAPAATAGVIDLRADMSGFDKQEVRVKVGEPITIRLTSLDNSHHTDGGGKHQWAVDDFKASVVAPPEGSNTVTFTPDKPGEFTYYCDICCGGRANPSMQGKLIVEA
jgi:heme/copper-type cytochrome/quinol oxidase subunit 2